jgi:hypothetical protein
MNTKPLFQTVVPGCCMRATTIAATHSSTRNLQHFQFFKLCFTRCDGPWTGWLVEGGGGVLFSINISFGHHCVQTDQWASNPVSYATNIGGASSGDKAAWVRNTPSRAKDYNLWNFNCRPQLPSWSVLSSWDKYTYGIERCGSKWINRNTGVP